MARRREAYLATSKQQVSTFLNEFKSLIARNSFQFVQRLETNKTATSLGLTNELAKREILNLSVVDYSSGPEADRDKPGDVWVFGKEINGCEIYIKLKIYTVGTTKYAKCISFHEADYYLNHPFAP
jgi:hypothetical protein